MTVELQEFCDQAIEATWSQPYFMYYGGADRETDAFTFSRTRDSDILDISNFDVIYQDLKKRFPDNVWIERANHFLCGWVDYVVVRMLHRDKIPSLDGTLQLRPTFAASAVQEWCDALEEYPVADEAALSEAEYNAKLETLERNFGCSFDEAESVLEWMHNNGTPGEDDFGDDFWPEQSDVDLALLDLGLRMSCRDCGDVLEPDEVTERRGVCRFCTYGYRIKSWFRGFQYRLQRESFLRQRERFGITRH